MSATEDNAVPVHDLRGEVCPMTFVRAKIQLDRMEPGDSAEFLLNPGEQLKNVPRSIKSEGHKIESVRQEDDGWYLLVRRGE